MSDPGKSFSASQDASQDIDVERLLRLLRRKEDTWVEWGRACQTLQKVGQSPQSIFEATGFEPIQQNQIIVATQIYTNLVNNQATEAVLDYFAERRSDILYEFRILDQSDRVKAATLAMEHQIDADEAHLIAKAIRDFSRLKKPPEGFSDSPGDAIAYECWRLARQKDDLQERSRLIARGLTYAAHAASRKQLENLLTDFSVITATEAPRLPLYRLETSDEMPRVIPVLGYWPVRPSDWATLPFLSEEDGPFNIVRHNGASAWFAVPGWKVVLQAEDPIALLANSNQLNLDIPEPIETVLVIIDRAQRQWSRDRYFLLEDHDELVFQAFEQSPTVKLLGCIVLIIRPSKVIDNLENKDIWLIDE